MGCSCEKDARAPGVAETRLSATGALEALRPTACSILSGEPHCCTKGLPVAGSAKIFEEAYEMLLSLRLTVAEAGGHCGCYVLESSVGKMRLV